MNDLNHSSLKTNPVDHKLQISSCYSLWLVVAMVTEGAHNKPIITSLFLGDLTRVANTLCIKWPGIILKFQEFFPLERCSSTLGPKIELLRAH